MAAGVTVTNAQDEFPDQDVAFRRTIVYDVDEKHDTLFALSSQVSTELTILSDHRTKVRLLPIHERFFAPITKLKVKFNRSSVSSDNILYGVDAWSDEFLPSYKLYTILLPAEPKTDDVVSSSYREQFSDLAFLPIISVPNVDSMIEYRITFKHPDDVTVDFELYFPRDSVPYSVHRSDEETTIDFSNLRYDEPLTFFPENYHAAVLCRLKHNQKEINPVSPHEFVAWYHRAANPLVPIDSLQRATFDKHLAGTSSFADTMKAIYDYVKTNIRYVADERGLNAYIPRAPSSTMASGFGDCKDRVALVAGIAACYGIHILTVFVPPPEAPAFNGVHVEMFDHVIGAVEIGSRLVYFDPTEKYCEFGNLPDHDVGKRVFVFGGESGRFETIHVPQRNPALDVTIDADLRFLKDCRAVVVLRNDLMQTALHARHDLTNDKFLETLGLEVANNLYQVRLDSLDVVAERESSLTVSARADLSRFFVASGQKFYVPRAPFAQFDNDVLERMGDHAAIVFPSTVDLKLRVAVRGPAVEVLPDSVHLGAGSFVFKATAAPADSIAVFDFRYTRDSVAISPEEKGAFINEYRAYLGNKKNVFVIKRRLP